MKQERISEMATVFLALSDNTRLRLIDLMRGGEVSVGFLADSLGESQPKISRHLAYLRGAGIVSTRRDGKRIFYAIRMPTGPASENILLATLTSLTILSGRAPGETEPRHGAQSLNNYSSAAEDVLPEAYVSEPEEEEFPVYLL